MSTVFGLARKAREKGSAGAVKAMWGRVRRGAESALVSTFRLPLSLLPARMVARVKGSIRPVAQLDYAGSKILLHVDSELDLLRAGSCRKEPETVRWIEEFIKPGDVLFDVGANVGAYSLVTSGHCGGKVTVHSFEPSFSTYSQLCRNVVLNGCQESIFPHMIALSKESGVSVFNYTSIEAGTALHALGENVDFKGEAFEPVYRQQVITFTIDDLVSRFHFPVPNHLKLDVDGIELDILQGARETLNDPRVRSLLVEMCHKRGDVGIITQLLEGHGFRVVSEAEHEAGVIDCVFERAG
jgi:FkbM family methyltransferase